MISCEACNATGLVPITQTAYAVGDWVECGTMQSKIMEIRETITNRQIYHMKEANGIEYDADAYAFERKLSPSEVVIRIGCLSGTVMPNGSPYKETDAVFFLVNDDCDESCCIPFAMLDEPTRNLVKELLEKQGEGK